MKKVVIVGLGYVGKAYAYSLITKNNIDELILIDKDKDKLYGNYLDLKDAAFFSNVLVKIGDYNDCSDANLVVICAGKNQEKNESRLDLLKYNKDLIKDITNNVVASSFNGLFLVATNPVDICTYLVYKYSKFDKNKVLGTGTLLDTIRLKRILKEKLNVSYNDIEAFVLGEHGNSSYIVWSNTKIKGVSIDEYLSLEEKKSIENQVHNAAYEIINKKGETSYGIGSVLSYLTDILLNNEYKKEIISSVSIESCFSNLCIINSNGIKMKIDLSMNEEEYKKEKVSKKIIKDAISSLED